MCVYVYGEYIHIPYSRKIWQALNLAGIKFGELAKNDYKRILAKFKFGNLHWRMT